MHGMLPFTAYGGSETIVCRLPAPPQPDAICQTQASFLRLTLEAGEIVECRECLSLYCMQSDVVLQPIPLHV